MFGWIFTLSQNNSISINYENSYNYDDLGISFYYNKYPKFENDKIFLDNNKYLIILDGVIFNIKELTKKYSQKSWENTVIYMCENLGENFCNEMRGSFNGIIFKKDKKEFITFTNQIGDRTIFHYSDNENIIISSNLNFMHDILKYNNIGFSLDENYVKYMLTFGFMLDDTTFINEVKRLLPGYCAVYDNTFFREKKYFEFDNSEELDISEEEAIRKIDEAFINAVKLEMNKDKEYGYKSIIDISGGLDSRAVNYACKRLGYSDILNISYSQMDSNEELVTRELIKDLGNDYLFKSLDNASFIYEVDELIGKNYGLTIFSGFTGGKQLLELINMSNMGIQHTGLLGDVNDGSFSSVPYHENPYFEPKYRFSNLLDEKILDRSVLDSYRNHELFCFYTRGLLGGLGTHLIRQNYIETYSPFEDVDFLNLTFKLPIKMRVSDHIFRKWLIKYYPEATAIVYDHTMCKITDNKLKVFLKKAMLYGPPKVKRILGIKETQKGRRSMNPFEYWYSNNEKIRLFIENYYKENSNLIESYSELSRFIDIMYNKGNTIDKMAVLTVLSVMKRYFK